MSEQQRLSPETDCNTILHFLANSAEPERLAHLVSRDYAHLCDEIADSNDGLARNLVSRFGEAMLGKQDSSNLIGSSDNAPEQLEWWEKLLAYFKRTSLNRFCVYLIATGATLVASAAGYLEILIALIFDYTIEESEDPTGLKLSGWAGIALIALGIVIRLTSYVLRKRHEFRIKNLTINAARLYSQIKLLQQPNAENRRSVLGFTLRQTARNVMAAQDPKFTSSVALLELTCVRRFTRYVSTDDFGIGRIEFDSLREMLENEIRNPRTNQRTSVSRSGG